MLLTTYLTLLTGINSGNYSITSSAVAVQQAFSGYVLTPGLIPVLPPNFIIVTYASRLQVVLGNKLRLDQVQAQPLYVGFYACPERYYTLIFLDPDSPDHLIPSELQYRLWHVGNIPADDVSAGETLATYLAPRPEPGNRPHRCTFLVYRQKHKLVFDEPRLLNTRREGRSGFSLARYVEKYDLTLIAGNFYQTAGGDTGCLQGVVPLASLI